VYEKDMNMRIIIYLMVYFVVRAYFKMGFLINEHGLTIAMDMYINTFLLVHAGCLLVGLIMKAELKDREKRILRQTKETNDKTI
jgi:hypothetical protein